MFSATMFGLFSILAVIFMVVVLPVWLLLHYLTRMKEVGGLSAEDENTLEKVWKTTSRLEERIKTLETILDEHHPHWRNDNDNRQ